MTARAQLMFTFGHEYSHHTLNHLSQSNERHITLGDPFKIRAKDNRITTYGYNHKKEYDADLQSIKNIKDYRYARILLIDSAFLLFIYLDILDNVYQSLSLRQSFSLTHPKPLDRLWHLRKQLKGSLGASMDVIESYLRIAANIKRALSTEWIPYRIEELERYGSVYLPSFRTKILTDRVDF